MYRVIVLLLFLLFAPLRVANFQLYFTRCAQHMLSEAGFRVSLSVTMLTCPFYVVGCRWCVVLLRLLLKVSSHCQKAVSIRCCYTAF